MVRHEHRHRRPKTSRVLARRRESRSGNDCQGQFARIHLIKRSLGLLTLSASVLLVNGTHPRGVAHARTSDQSYATDAGETTQAKIVRAMSAGPTDVVKSARIIATDTQGNIVE